VGGPSSDPGTERLDAIERMLTESGRDVGSTGARVAAGRSGVALRFPGGQMLHVSWLPLCAIALALAATALRRRRR
jgi:hypothetical protein